MTKKFAIVLALFLIAVVCCAGCIDPETPVDPVVPADPIVPVDPVTPVEPELPVEEYAVMFMLNYDDAGAYTAETVKAGDTVSRPASPSRSGYTFTGWFTAADGGVAYDFTLAVNSDVMLYAQWKEEKKKSSHSHSYSRIVTDPTCIAEGYTTYTCRCGASYKGDTTPINPDNHDLVLVTNESGEYNDCNRCDYSKVLVDRWDGTADTSWYDPTNPKTEYVMSSVEQLSGLSELVSGDTTFKGVTFKLDKDLDLYVEDTSENADGDPVTFRPIGDHSKAGTFEGTFDGQGHTISNLYQNGWDLGYEWGVYGSYGLFGNVNDATIKNLKISGSESYIEGGDTSFITGSATGNCVFENITIEDSVSATYNNGNGGIIGWSGAGEYRFKNIKIGSDVVLAGLWGSFDSSIGGIVGQAEPGATYNFENVDIACRLDVYNDCTASNDYYNYRMCGMIIGRLEETTTIDGSNYPDTSKYDITCNNVTVTYGDWANYHYCEPTPGLNGGRGMRVEAGYAYDGLPADYDHSQCVDNHMNLIQFDQIFGGAQYAVKGLKTYDGVTVIYNNK